MNSDAKTELRPSGQSSSSNSDVASRLRIAVRYGGGNKAVSERSGVKLSSLNNYLRQVSRIPADVAASVAKACNVSVDWLLRGEGPMEYLPIGHVTAEDEEVIQGPTLSVADADQAEQLAPDPELLANALQAADYLFKVKRIQPAPRQRMQVMMLIYNHLIDLQKRIDESADDGAS